MSSTIIAKAFFTPLRSLTKNPLPKQQMAVHEYFMLN